MNDEMILVPRAELLAWAKAWLNEYDPNDGTDCVTPFDTYLLKSPVEARCTCPSGDGSLRWPCPAHPAEAQPVGDVGEFGVGIQPNPKARYWQGRAEFWKAQAVALGWREKRDAANGETPPSAPVEKFTVKHYTEDEGPTIKGNGFDGLRIGEDRDEAEEFIRWVNAHLAQQPASDGGFTAADMMDERQEGRKEAQQLAGVDGAMVERMAQAVATELYGEPPPPGSNSLTRAMMLPGIRRALTAALAAQQGGRSDDFLALCGQESEEE